MRFFYFNFYFFFFFEKTLKDISATLLKLENVLLNISTNIIVSHL